MILKSFAQQAGLAAAIMLGGIAAASAAPAEATGSVNVRSGPGTGYRVVDTLRAGETVDVLSCRGTWCRIEHSGPDGWVSANYLGRGGFDDDDDYYEDDYEADIIIRSPRRVYRSYDYYDDDFYYRPYPRRPSASFCFGSSNAALCLNN